MFCEALRAACGEDGGSGTSAPGWGGRPRAARSASRSSALCFCHCTCFGEGLLAQFAKKCEALAPGTLVIVVSHLLRSNLFEMVHTAPYVMTWGEGTVYVYRRKALPKWIGGLSIGGKR